MFHCQESQPPLLCKIYQQNGLQPAHLYMEDSLWMKTHLLVAVVFVFVVFAVDAGI